MVGCQNHGALGTIMREPLIRRVSPKSQSTHPSKSQTLHTLSCDVGGRVFKGAPELLVGLNGLLG